MNMKESRFQEPVNESPFDSFLIKYFVIMGWAT